MYDFIKNIILQINKNNSVNTKVNLIKKKEKKKYNTNSYGHIKINKIS